MYYITLRNSFKKEKKLKNSIFTFDFCILLFAFLIIFFLDFKVLEIEHNYQRGLQVFFNNFWMYPGTPQTEFNVKTLQVDIFIAMFQKSSGNIIIIIVY